MTRYLVTDTQLRSAINEAISEQDRDRQGPNYVIRTCGDVANHVLRLLGQYKVAESEATPVVGPLREVTLAEARPGDIATFEITISPEKGKFVCTLKKNGDDMGLYSDEWLTANKMGPWCIRELAGDEGLDMKDLHIWRWDGLEEAVELPEEPMATGLYVTATSDQVLYNDGTYCANWSRPHGARWSTGKTYEDWEVVVHDLGSERLPLKFISASED